MAHVETPIAHAVYPFALMMTYALKQLEVKNRILRSNSVLVKLGEVFNIAVGTDSRVDLIKVAATNRDLTPNCDG